MGLESASFISDLNASWPLGSDPRFQGDDHMRLIKAVLQSQFPNLGQEAVTVSAAELNGGGMPTGSMVDFAGATAPGGFLLCNGGAVSRTTYADLFAIIGTTYGVGNGTTTFNLPDLRGRVAAAPDNMGGSSANRIVNAAGDILGGAMGAELHTLTEAQLPVVSKTTSTAGNHTHTYKGRRNGLGSELASETNRARITENTGAAGNHTHTVSFGSGNAHNNVQPTIFINKIIKT